jgi:large subunit ribosomal protein L22
MQVSAKAKYVRMSPRKVRLVVNAVRGLEIVDAQNQLRFMNKAAAEPVLKLLNSAVANAEHNFKLKLENLYIHTITADGGPTLHRWKARARGRAAPIRKRTTHINIILDEKEVVQKEVKPAKEEVKKVKKPAKAKVAKAEKKEIKPEAKKTEKESKK